MQGNQNNIAFLDANFNAWITGAVGDGTGAMASWTLASGGAGAGYFSQQMYILAYNAPTSVSDASRLVHEPTAWVFPGG